MYGPLPSPAADLLVAPSVMSAPGAVAVAEAARQLSAVLLHIAGDTQVVAGIAINGVQPTYQSISSFKYPGARPLYIYVKNAHVRAIPAIRAFVAEFTKESAIGPNGYLKQFGLVAAPAGIRAKSQQAARTLTPVKFAELK